jgi:hypothetical protein
MADPKREMLRHAVATVAYRGGKALRDAPDSFAGYQPAATSRTPVQIVAHIGDLFEWALSIARNAQQWRPSAPLPWPHEVARFFDTIGRFDAFLSSDEPMAASPEQLLQGPVADALTHVGQLTMLRRMSGATMRSESYFQADIVAGRVGPDQSVPHREFD